MKKIKRLLAMIMAMTMVLGMAMTVSAAPEPVSDIKSDITIKGLSQGVETTVKMYQFASLQYDMETNEYSWKIEDWASEYVELNDDKTAYEITDKDGLKRAAQDQTVPSAEQESLATEVTFKGVLIGAYVIMPSDTNADYEPLFVTNTYDRDNSPSEGKPVAKDVIAYAKSESHTVTKELEKGDDFAQIGEDVQYTIHATFPISEDSEGNKLDSFKIIDTPDGLAIKKDTVEVVLGTSDVTDNVEITVGETGVLTIDFKDLLSGGYDGYDITITYDATVTDVEYNNNASASSNTTTYKPGKVEGSNGSITITKKDAEDKKITLTGVTFKVYDLGVDGSWAPETAGAPMEFVFDANLNAYRPALSTDKGDDVVTKITDKDGLVTIKGLDEGNYHFEEVVAPDGYSINEEGLTVTIDPTDEKINVEGEFLDTKLASLPSTGGIGTTIFTIGGCAIMIAAAALYFVNRRKSEEN